MSNIKQSNPKVKNKIASSEENTRFTVIVNVKTQLNVCKKKKEKKKVRRGTDVGDMSQAYPMSTTRCLGELLRVFLAVHYQELLMIFHMNLSAC